MFSSQFKEMELTVDSGAAKTAFPTGMFQSFISYKDSNLSCRVANGQMVHSQGNAKVGVYTEDNAYQELTGELFNEVPSALLSVSAMIDKGHKVVFDYDGSHILLRSGRKLMMRRRNGVFKLPVYDAMCFGRQGNSL